MKRIVPALLFLAVTAVACGRPAAPEPPSGGGEPLDARKMAIYEASIRALYETEGWYDPVFIDERICADFVGMREPECEGRFSLTEQTALLEALSDLPGVRFTARAERVTKRIFEGRLEGAGLLSVGPIDGDGARVEVPGSAYCGGLCGHWMTWVVARSAGTWEVTGTTGPVAIS